MIKSNKHMGLKSQSRLSELKTPLIITGVFWVLAIVLWQTTGKIFYLFNFVYIAEIEVQKMMAKAGVYDIKSRRIIWKNTYASGGDAWDFFAAISSSWQYSKYPPEKRQADYKKVRAYFDKNKKNIVTDDVILAYGLKQ